MFVKELFKEKFLRKYYNIINNISRNLFKNKNGKFKIPENYKLQFSDNFKKLNEDIWETRMYFGEINTSYPWAYAANGACKFGKNGFESHLYYNEREIKHWDKNTYNTTWDVGYLTSKIPFEYGIYEWDIILPQGERLWSAIWLTSFVGWPPEIDIIEAFTDEFGNYNSNLESNLHFNKYPNNQTIGGLSNFKLTEEETKEVINLKLLYEENQIDFYINNFKIRSIKNKDVLKWFNNQRFHVVMNNGNGFDNELMSKDHHSILYVKQFNYYTK